MSITFRCRCGESLETEDQYAGMQVECPTCQALVTAPAAPAIAKRPAAAPAYDVTPAERPSRRDEDDRPSRRRDEYQEDDEPPQRRRRRPTDDDPKDPAVRAYMSKARADIRDEEEHRRRQKNEHRSLEGRILNGSAIGGLVAMLVAVVWFVAGLFADIIFFYPPILFVIGLIGFFKGLVSGGRGDD